jgi:anti-sigma factor RsiW
MHLTDDQLNEYLDGEIHDRARADAHLSSCAGCAARLAVLQTLFAEIESLPEAALTRDLDWRAAPRARPLTGPGVPPRWFTLTAGLQTAVALAAIILAAPFVIELASSSLPVLKTPSPTELFFQAQSLWISWLDALSQLQLPTVPELPVALQPSGSYFMLTLAGAAMAWLAGNGILLRNQIK